MRRFAVTLRQLDREVTQAGLNLPDLELAGVESPELKAMLRKFLALVPACEFPVAPEIRIRGDTGAFFLKASHGQLRFDSWANNTSVANPTLDFMLAAIEGTEVEVVEEQPRQAAASPAALARLKVILLAVAILAVNGVTVWQLVAPAALPEALVPPVQALPDDLAEETRRRFAGAYATGGGPGDRALIIPPSGEARWQVLGPGGAVVEDQPVRLRAVESRGERGLMADNHGLMLLADGGSALTYFGDRYRRK